MKSFNFFNIVKQVLNESFQDYEYHFTNFYTAYSICKSNRIPLAPTLGKGTERHINGNNIFFLSLTRRRNGEVGYSSHRNVRIVFDGNKLNTQFKGKAIDYWGNSMGKNEMYRKLYNYDERKANPSIPIKYKNDLSDENLKQFYQNPFQRKDGETYDQFVERMRKNIPGAKYSRDESEDRLLTKKPFIDNANRYIISIDILIDPTKERDIINARTIYNTAYFHDKINIFDNKQDFNSLNGKNINSKFDFGKWDKHGEFYDLGERHLSDNIDYTEIDKGIQLLANFFKFLSFYNFISKGKRRGTEIKQMLQRGGLTDYIHHISEIIKESDMGLYGWSEVSEWNYFFRLIQEAYEMRSENGAELVRFFSDWYKKMGFKNEDNFKNKLQSIKQGNTTDDFDYHTKKTFLVYGRTIIPYPQKTDFWKVIKANDRYDKEYFTDGIEEYMNEHNIPMQGGQERFHKYMQHLWRKCSVSYMMNLLDKITGNGNEYLKAWYGKGMEEKTLDLWDAYKYYLPGYTLMDYKENENEIKQLFRKNN